MLIFRMFGRQIASFPASTIPRLTPSLRSTIPRVQQCRAVKPSPLTLRTEEVLKKRLFRRYYSQKPPSNPQPHPTPHLNSPEPHSLTARLKKLSREYGWTVIGVYLVLTVADFPFCFLAVKYIGAERVAYAEHVIVGGAKDVIQKVFPNAFQETMEGKTEIEVAEADNNASIAENGEPTLWTQLALAFVIHKSFIFIRVPLTAAITPKVVKILRGWGYDIGKRRPKSK